MAIWSQRAVFENFTFRTYVRKHYLDYFDVKNTISTIFYKFP